MTKKYSFGKAVPMDFEHTIDAVTEALEMEGFGILTDCDMRSTLKNKPGEDMPSCRIFGISTPPHLHPAFADIGQLLPCNMVVRQAADGAVFVEFIDPAAVLSQVDNPAVNALAIEVRGCLDHVLEAL